MLTAHRRHKKSCPHRDKGWNYTLCGCPVWCGGLLHGKRIMRSLHTSNWERALHRITLLESGQESDVAPDQSVVTVDRAARDYLTELAARNLKPATIVSYKQTLENLVKVAPGPLSAFDVSRLSAIQQARSRPASETETGRKPRTMRKELEHLRAFFAWCQDRKWITDNPAKRVRMPLVEDVATLPYTPAEVARLIEATNNIASTNSEKTPYIRKRARAVVYALLYSGLRISDVATLRRAALDPVTRHLTLRTTKTGVPVKVQLHPDACAALLSLPAQNPEYFFWTGRGQIERCAKNMWRTVQRLGTLAGVHAHPHRFRDTFAVELLTHGADIRTVQQLLGHESVRTTEKHYAHFIAAHQQILDSATAKLDFTKPAAPVLMHTLKNRRRNTK